MNGAFWALALALVGATWAVLWVGTRRGVAAGSTPGRADVRLLDEALAALRAEFARGAIDAAQHERERAELERRVVDEAAAGPVASGAGGAAVGTLAGLAVALPVFAVAGYLALGNPAALSSIAAARPAAESNVSAEDVQAMVETLAERLRSRPPGQPEDLPGWTMLARSYAALQRFDDAAGAYQRAVDLAPNDAALLADLADVLAMRNGFGGAAHADDRSTRLVERALQIDPRNLKALALAGSAAFERHDTAAAIDFWRRARALAPPGSEFASGLDQSLADAGAPLASAAPSAEAAPGGSVRGQVRLAPALAARVAPGDTLFVFARAANGPPMPLAILRRTAGALPIDFTLDDSLAMTPDWRISQVRSLVVGARVSRSGDAMPRTGDLVGQVEAVAGDAAVSITIDRVQP